jgi:hypothetical protein
MLQVPAMFANNSSENSLLMAAIGAGAGVYFFYRGFRLLQRRRLILNTPASKIRSASMGLVEISGLATGPYVITSPLKQADCFYYRSVAWELRQKGKNSEWVKIGEEILHVPFYIDDGTGALLIDPRGADMDLHCDFHEEYHHSIMLGGPEMPASVGQFLQRHGADFGRRIKVEEYCVKPKNFLFVLGSLLQNPGLDAGIAHAGQAAAQRAMNAGESAGAGGQSDQANATADGVPSYIRNSQIVRLSGAVGMQSSVQMTQQQKVAAALIKAGITNPAAWAAAEVAPNASDLTLAGGGAQTISGGPRPNPFSGEGSFDLHPPVVLMKGTHEPTFLISWRSQRDLLSSLGWKSALMIWGGPALTLVCIYFLLAHFNLL